MWDINILTFFPEMFPGPLGYSIINRAIDMGMLSIKAHNIKDYAVSNGRVVDDTSYGGGGMVMRPDVLSAAIDDIFATNSNPIVYLSPRGKKFTQNVAETLVDYDGINFICGRFEGIDERVIDEYNVQEISVGDYVLSGGDIAAMVVIDACARLIDGVVNNKQSIAEESFAGEYAGLLEYPHYTKPANWRGKSVPSVLLSGHHENIRQWRLDMAMKITAERRSDLLNIVDDKKK